MNSDTLTEVIISIKYVRKVGNLLLTITNMFEPPHKYVAEISTAIHSDRQLPLSFTKTSVKQYTVQ